MRRHLQLIFTAILLLGLSPAAEQKRLAVYSSQTSFTIPVTDHEGKEYISITDLFDPFGNVTLTHKGDRWKLRLAPGSGSPLEAEFNDGSEAAKVRGKKIQLAHPFWTDGQRGYVPLNSAPVLMVQFTRQSANLRENSRRLFVGNVSTTYSAEMNKNAPNKVVLHFSSAVNPNISTEPGRVRLIFDRDPVIPSGTNPRTFDSSTIRSANFSESNGSAELTIDTTAPTLATFSNGGRTITLTASPPPVEEAQNPPKGATPATSAPPAQVQVPAATPSATTAAPAPAMPAFFVIIDPAHGGDDAGATLGDGQLEKNVTIAIARRIRAELQDRGVGAILLRDGDSTIATDQRAIAANASRGALYIGIHATTFGTGVHLYTARLSNPLKPASQVFLPWDSAQAAYLDASHNLAASLVTEFDSRQIQSAPLESGMRPLRNIAKPAIVIEVAEPATVPEAVKEGLTSIPYQQSIATAIANAVANMRGNAGVTK